MSTSQTQHRYEGTGAIDRFIQQSNEPEWLRDLRSVALTKFSAQDWPTTEIEEWRRTDLAMYDFDSYSFFPGEPSSASTELPKDSSAVVSFVDGSCTGIAVDPAMEAAGVVVTSLLDAAKGAYGPETAALVGEHAAGVLHTNLENADNKLQAWNFASFTYGAFVFIPKGVSVPEPIYLEFSESGNSRLSAPYTVIVAENSSDAMIVQTINGSEEGEVLMNEGIGVRVGEQSHVRFMSMQNLNIDSTYFCFGNGSIQKDGDLQHYLCSFGGMLAKSRFDCTLDGEGSLVRLNGLYFPFEDQQMDMRTVQHHRAPHAESRTYYKGAVRDEAHAIYQGLIEVAPNATQTDAYLTNKNLILNDGARADSIPTLQINTDDVRCSHGSSTGKLDLLQLHYLHSRGYSPVEAEETLLMGFFEDIIDKAPERIQDVLRRLVSERVYEAHDTEG